MNPLFWTVVLAVGILLLFIVGITLGKIKRGKTPEKMPAEDRREKLRVSGEDD